MADKITKRTLSRKRILGNTILLLIPFIILLLRLYQVQIIEGLVHRNQTDRQAIKYVITPPVRGQIYSADGKILAGNKSHYDLTMNPSQMRSRSGYIYTSSYMLNTATFIQNNLVNRTHNLNIKSLRKRMQLDMAQPIVLYKDLTEEEITRVAEFSPPIKGLDISQRIERDYPLPGVASHILGYTTWKNRTQKFNNSKNKFSTFTSKELLGNSGLEYLYDKELSGYPGIKNVLMDPLGFVVKELPGSTYPVNGFDLVLTIDSKAQAAADNALKGHTGAIVAINPQNGAILAIASSPTYDLSQLTPKLLAEMSNDNVGRPTYNRATAGTYMPGSIVKPLVALAALEHGDISFDTTCDCKGYIYVGGRQVRCAKRDGHGVLNLSDAIVVSCNPYFIQTGMTCKLKVLQPMFEAAGFGSKTGCFDPLVKYLGTLPSAETAFRIRRRNWTASDTALASIGQGLIQLSPLQAALYTAALANGGKLWKPFIVQQIKNKDGQIIKSTMPSLRNTLPASQKNLDFIRDAMINAVKGDNASARAMLASGIPLAAKTGTAEVDGSFKRYKNTWIICYGPIPDPSFAVACIIEKGDSGGRTTAPVVVNFLKQWLTAK